VAPPSPARVSYRGGRVISKHPSKGIFASHGATHHRTTRRYVGSHCPFGVVVVILGFAGAAFHQDKEQEMANGAKLTIGSYNAHLPPYTDDDAPNYAHRLGRYSTS